MAEIFFATLEREVIDRRRFKSWDEALIGSQQRGRRLAPCQIG